MAGKCGIGVQIEVRVQIGNDLEVAKKDLFAIVLFILLNRKKDVSFK